MNDCDQFKYPVGMVIETSLLKHFMATRSKTPAKRKGTKAPAKKKTTKKTASKKKSVLKKRVVAKKKIPTKKAASRKKAVVAKKAAIRKPAARKAKATVPRIPIPKKEQVIEPKEIEKPAEINNDSVVIDKDKVENTPPPVEENTPVVKVDTTGMLGTDKKSLQVAAARHNDNHRLRLSSTRKGGIKPAGKKPLW